MARFTLSRFLTTAMLGVLTTVAGVVTYRMVRSDVAAGMYRSKLESLARDYSALRETYNEAVRKSVVTELLVKNGTLCVVVRNAAGERETIETPFDPSREIYVDYVLVDGRLLIRRVFERMRIGLAEEPDVRASARSSYAYRGLRERYGMVRSRESLLPFDLVFQGSLTDLRFGAFPRFRVPRETPDAFLYR